MALAINGFNEKQTQVIETGLPWIGQVTALFK
jgi:hypothetical protein